MILEKLLRDGGLDLESDKLKKLERFVEIFLAKNLELNLTKVEDERSFLIKHIVDSIYLNQTADIKPGMKVADLGTGGGLPGIVLAILNPKAEFVLVDAVQKKIAAVTGFAADLNLNNVTGVSERLELLGRDGKFREQFDLVTARALAPLPTLLELATPLVKRKGQFIAMKGPGYLEETAQADVAIEKLNVTQPFVEKYELPEGMGKRYLLVFDKKKGTPHMFPRRDGVPKRSPL